MKRILLGFLILVVGSKSYAQISSCAQTLRLAQSTYEQGRLHELPGLLESCLKNIGASGFTKDERVRAYKLLAMAYIYLEEPEKADDAMLNLLRTDPYFTPNPDVDPAEFIGLFNTFRTTPIYRLGVKFGANATQPNVSAYTPITNGSGKYSYKIALNFGIAGEMPINSKLTLAGELNYVQKSFQNVVTVPYPNDALNQASTSTGLETQSWVSLPISAQYKLKQSRLNPFLTGGVVTDYLLSASISGTQKRQGAQSIESQTFTVTPQRNTVNVSLALGAGIKLRVAGGYFLTEARFSYGLVKISSEKNLLANQALLWNYGLVDGVFSLNSLSFSVGYVQNFFNPKKLKRK